MAFKVRAGGEKEGWDGVSARHAPSHCGIIRFLRQNGQPEVDFKGQLYADFQSTLDTEMKRLKQVGISSDKRQPEPLSPEEEELLWKKGILGDHSPQALLNNVFFSMEFALLSEVEMNTDNCTSRSVIQVVEKPGERAYFVYTEDSSMNNQRGLKGRKLKTKQVVHHENSANPSRCPVWLFKLYKSLCPQVPKENAFYLQPLKKPKQNCWFSIKPVGHKILSTPW